MNYEVQVCQSDKFKEVVSGFECDEDEARLENNVRKVVKQKPDAEKPK